MIYRGNAIRQLHNLMIFGDNPNGEIFYVDADTLTSGNGQNGVRRLMFNDKGTRKSLLQLIREKNTVQGKDAAPRADMRLGVGANDQLFILNKRDGVIRLVVPDGVGSPWREPGSRASAPGLLRQRFAFLPNTNDPAP